jgi:multisubunit Na+/H+ antiporter MnhB subunit
MNIVNFTPITAFTGGIIIGLAVVIFFLLNGRLVGISGIASNALTSKENKLRQYFILNRVNYLAQLFTLFFQITQSI